jgi:hypothetical protein
VAKALTKTAKKDILAKAEEIEQKSIQETAMEMVPDAMETLKRLMKGRAIGQAKPNASVVRSAARDVIEFAGGRPETRDPVKGDVNGMQIYIQQFGPEVTEKVLVHILGNKKEPAPKAIDVAFSEEFDVEDES